jgi:hypothetical protein
MIHYSTPPENPDTSKTTRTMLRRSQTTKRWYQQRKKYFLLQIPTNDIRLQILQDPTNSVLQRARQQQRAQAELDSGNDHVLLATTRQKTTNLDTLLSSKEGCSASKTDISSTAGQPGPSKDHIHQSTQAWCDPRSDADLHRTVARKCGKINSKLLDDGTSPTSQDFFHSLQDLQDSQLSPGGCSTSQTTVIMATEVSNYTARHLMNRSSTPGGYL